jgi:ribonuclease Z
MPTVHLLGTGASISDPHRTTTMLAFSDAAAGSTLAVDCGGDLVQRLLAAEIPLGTLDALVVTHAHPDHVSGFPLFMEKVWLSEREQALPVCGIENALAQTRRSWDAFAPVHADWDVPPIDWRTVAHAPDTTLWDGAPWHVTAAPVDHGDMPNIGLRVEHRPSGSVAAYSCDTAPCEAVVTLARGADLLVHEANGVGDTHSTAAEAASIARHANAEALLLVHLPPGDKSDALREARAIFPNTRLGNEEGAYPLP